MIVVAIDFNTEDNPDLKYPYIIDTTSLPEDIREKFEGRHCHIDMTPKEYDLYLDSRILLTPQIEGVISKIVEIWY